MPVYDYEGQFYDLDITDPAEARRRIESHLGRKTIGEQAKDIGKGIASVADVAYNVIPSTIGQVAYGVQRAMGQTPEQATSTTETINQYMADPLGKAFGITQDPAYRGEAARRGTEYLGQKMGQGAEYVAQQTGVPSADVQNMMNTAMVATAPAVARASRPIAPAIYGTEQAITNAARATATGAADVAMFAPRAVKGAFMNEPYTPSSAMVPLTETYFPSAAGQKFMQGRMNLPELESTARPTAELRASPMFRAAERIANRGTAGEPLVPLPGRASEAFGERLMAGYKASPLSFAADVGLPALGIPPVSPILRGAQMLADKYLAAKTQFQPGFIERLAQERAKSALTPSSTPPMLPYNPSPAKPAPPQTMYVAPTGQAGTNLQQVGQTYLNQRYPVTPVEPLSPPKTPAAAQGANFVQSQIEKWGQTPGYQAPAIDFNAPGVNPTPGVPMPKPVTPGTTPSTPSPMMQAMASNPKTADILAQIRARSGEGPRPNLSFGQPKPAATTPVVPEGMPSTTPALPTDLTKLRERISQNQNPLEQAATEARVARGLEISQRRIERNKPDIQLRKDIKETAKGFVNKKGDTITVDRSAFNELMPEGKTIDWSQAPDVSSMNLKDARMAVRKFVFSESKKKVSPELPSNLFETQAPPDVSMMVPAQQRSMPKISIRQAVPEKDLLMHELKASTNEYGVKTSSSINDRGQNIDIIDKPQGPFIYKKTDPTNSTEIITTIFNDGSYSQQVRIGNLEYTKDLSGSEPLYSIDSVGGPVGVSTGMFDKKVYGDPKMIKDLKIKTSKDLEKIVNDIIEKNKE